jgi:hypothetical protein
LSQKSDVFLTFIFGHPNAAENKVFSMGMAYFLWFWSWNTALDSTFWGFAMPNKHFTYAHVFKKSLHKLTPSSFRYGKKI